VCLFPDYPLFNLSHLDHADMTYVIFNYRRWCAHQAEERTAKEAMKQQQGMQGQQWDNSEPRTWSKFED